MVQLDFLPGALRDLVPSTAQAPLAITETPPTLNVTSVEIDSDLYFELVQDFKNFMDALSTPEASPISKPHELPQPLAPPTPISHSLDSFTITTESDVISNKTSTNPTVNVDHQDIASLNTNIRPPDAENPSTAPVPGKLTSSEAIIMAGPQVRAKQLKSTQPQNIQGQETHYVSPIRAHQASPSVKLNHAFLLNKDVLPKILEYENVSSFLKKVELSNLPAQSIASGLISVGENSLPNLPLEKPSDFMQVVHPETSELAAKVDSIKTASSTHLAPQGQGLSLPTPAPIVAGSSVTVPLTPVAVPATVVPSSLPHGVEILPVTISKNADGLDLVIQSKELGQIDIEFKLDENRVVKAVISTDLSRNMDLLRQQAILFTDSLKEKGFHTIDLSFQHQDTPHETADRKDDIVVLPHVDFEDIPNHQSIVKKYSTSDDRLDLRL